MPLENLVFAVAKQHLMTISARAVDDDGLPVQRTMRDLTKEDFLAMFSYADHKIKCNDTWGLWSDLSKMMFGADRKELKKRYENRDAEVKRFGPPPALGNQLEEELVKYFLLCSEIGCSQTIESLIEKVAELKKRFGISSDIGGRTWIKLFFRRHPDIAARSAQLIDVPRLTAVNRPAVKRYFQLVELVMEIAMAANNGAKPRVLAMDEINVSTTKKKARGRKHIGKAGAKTVYCPTEDGGGHISATFCVEYPNKVLCPMIIYESKRVKSAWCQGYPEAIHTAAPSGYQDEKSFCDWADRLIEELNGDVAILLLDQHHSHADLEALYRLREAKVFVVFLPPHCTHLLCVLDRAINGPFQTYLSKEANEARRAGKAPTKATISGFIRAAYAKATMSETNAVTGEVTCNIKSGFLACGIDVENWKVIPTVVTDADYKPAEAIFKAADDLREAAGQPVEARPTLVLTEAQLQELRADLLKPVLPVQARINTAQKANSKRRKHAEIGTGNYFIERELAALEAKMAKAATVTANKAARAQKKADKEAAKAAGAAAGPRKAGRKRRRDEDEEDDEEEPDVDAEEDEDEEDGEEADGTGEIIADVDYVMEHRWEKVGRGKNATKELWLKIKWSHLDVAAHDALPEEQVWKPLCNFIAQDDDGEDGLNPVVFEYIQSTLSQEEQDFIFDD